MMEKSQCNMVALHSSKGYAAWDRKITILGVSEIHNPLTKNLVHMSTSGTSACVPNFAKIREQGASPE